MTGAPWHAVSPRARGRVSVDARKAHHRPDVRARAHVATNPQVDCGLWAACIAAAQSGHFSRALSAGSIHSGRSGTECKRRARGLPHRLLRHARVSADRPAQTREYLRPLPPAARDRDARSAQSRRRFRPCQIPPVSALWAEAVANNRRAHEKTPAEMMFPRPLPARGKDGPAVRGGWCSPTVTSTVATSGGTTSLMLARLWRSTPESGNVISTSSGLTMPTRFKDLRRFGADPVQLGQLCKERKQNFGAPAHASPIRASQASSSIVSMPKSAAFLAFDPAPGPATRISVFALTDPDTFAPRAFGAGLGLGAGHLFQRAGEDHGFARHGAVRGARSASCTDSSSAIRRSIEARSASCCKVRDQRCGHHRTHAVDPDQILPRGPGADFGSGHGLLESVPSACSDWPASAALLSPTCRMPSAKITRVERNCRVSRQSRQTDCWRDFSPQPSRFFSCCMPVPYRVAQGEDIGRLA